MVHGLCFQVIHFLRGKETEYVHICTENESKFKMLYSFILFSSMNLQSS